MPALLADFIAEEDAALETGLQGQLWPGKHYLITAALPKADTWLAPADREKLYFHSMRLSGTIPVVSDSELPHLVAAYRTLIPLLDTSRSHLARRHQLLFTFGFDEAGAIPDGVTTSTSRLKEFTKLTAYCLKFTNLPAQRTKLQGFRPYAPLGERAYQTLKHLGYRHERRYGLESYGTTDLLFWGMVLVVLLHEGRRADLIHDFLSDEHLVPQRDQYLPLLHASVETVVSVDCPVDPRFLDLAGQLAALERQRRESTEVAGLVRALALSFDENEAWSISIFIPEADNHRSAYLAPNLVCQMLPDPNHQWKINYIHSNSERLSEIPERILQNDLKIDGLGAGNLLHLPQWLKNTERKLGIRFDRSRAVVKCGRKRAAANRILEWLSE
ncbi:MAG TPA: hypothetical protein VIL09_08980 [Microvirga sp.]